MVMSSRTRSITSDMHRNMTVRLVSMWQTRPSPGSTHCGSRQATVSPTPTASLPQCSVSTAASSSSCESTESRWLLARPGVAVGAGMGAPGPGAPAAFVAISLATFRFGMMLLPPRFRPMDSRKSCMPTTMPMSSMQIVPQKSHSAMAQVQGPMMLTAGFNGSSLGGASLLGSSRGRGTKTSGCAASGGAAGAVAAGRTTGGAASCWSRTPSIRCNSSPMRPRAARTRTRSSRPMITAPPATAAWSATPTEPG
mmetsp:Transcript_9974/g.31062  ORF Transcript_9974/g.31062 Transcript_9974/m.31062 type:complete len:253 (+) Transcript_9974:163-921(+)